MTICGGFWPVVLDPTGTTNRGNAAAIFAKYNFRHHGRPRNPCRFDVIGTTI